MLDFLKSNRALILNGCVTPELNNFTFVTIRGSSVPDYFFTRLEDLSQCNEINTLLVKDIINDHNLEPQRQLPDHSFLKATFKTNVNINKEVQNNVEQIRFCLILKA